MSKPDAPRTAPAAKPAPAPVHDPARWRERFPILADTTYLVTHSLGAMPKTVYAKLEAFADQWATRGVRAWAEGWWSAPEDVGAKVGKLLNAPPGSVVMHQNVSMIQAVVASALDFSGARNKVVYTEQEFPSVMYAWEAQQKHGARIECVRGETSVGVSDERLLAAIDERTKIVPISHVCFRTSFRQDAAAVVRRAKEVGALVLLDCYQSLGTLPVDVQALGVDMVCGGSVKWLCGGPGAAYLYVRPGLMEQLEPSITGWAAHEAPFAFETGPQRYAEGPRRLLNGTPAVAALLAATAGYETLLEVGVDNVRRHSLALTERLRADLAARGFASPSPTNPEQRGGTLTVALMEDENGPAFVKALAERQILVDYRPGAGLRVSPHFYTLPEELARFAEVLSELRERRSWTKHVESLASY
jgi:kynureninase